jgi:hypothetical protein
MDADDMFGEPFVTNCDLEEGDYLTVTRIGNEGFKGSCVAVATLCAAAEAVLVDGVAMFKGAIILTPAQARQVAANLLDIADQCDGEFESLFAPKEMPDA